ncbi:MAG: hypothetical protein HFG53_12120 [Lachnospiraceae bacterium]|jgi:hypothetical protein|nr:hypothetical protein [Lachnospiraceae bacterium]
MRDFNNNAIEKLLQLEPSEKLLFKAFKGLKVKKKDRKSRRILIMVCIVLGAIVGMHQDTVSIFKESVDSILNILLGFFGIIFTGYALFQAFMNRELLFQLMTDIAKGENGEEKTRLQDINENFVYLMLLYVVAIIISLITKIGLFCISYDFLLFSTLIVNNIIAEIMITGYFIFMGIILWRTISFVSSIFYLFNVYAVAQLLEELDDGPNNNEER